MTLVAITAGLLVPAAALAGPAWADAGAAAAQPAAVTPHATMIPVPSNYVYDPSLGSLHDYCTDSPDSWGAADFRGPCAIHDLCYEAPGQHKSSCDAGLKANITNNCIAGYPTHPDACHAAGMTYYAAVVAFGDDPAVITKSTVRPSTSERQDRATFAAQN